MSSSWPGPPGDDYRRYTGDARPPEGGQQPPYAQQPYAQPPYAQPPYGQQPYGPPGSAYPAYGTPYGAMPYGSPYGAPGPRMTSGQRASTIVLLVLSALLTFVGCGAGLPSLVLAIVALSKDASDSSSSVRLMRIGWVVLGVLALAVVVLFVAIFGLHTETTVDTSTI